MLSRSITLVPLLVLLLVTGCASLSPVADRRAAADRFARTVGFEKVFIKKGAFVLTAYYRGTRPGDSLNVYIEGDGSAWLNGTWLSDDPTPREPLVLELAGMDPAANVAYLARPGQYAGSVPDGCNPSYWSDRRFAEEVVAAMNAAIDEMGESLRTKRINLVGYSGGGAISALIAARRNDVISLRTVAGNLDPEALNRHHRVSPLSRNSLNPLDVAAGLKGLPQRHFVGSQDYLVPPFVARSFLERVGSRDFREITIVDGATHARGWREQWRALLDVPLRRCPDVPERENSPATSE